MISEKLHNPHEYRETYDGSGPGPRWNYLPDALTTLEYYLDGEYNISRDKFLLELIDEVYEYGFELGIKAMKGEWID